MSSACPDSWPHPAGWQEYLVLVLVADQSRPVRAFPLMAGKGISPCGPEGQFPLWAVRAFPLAGRKGISHYGPVRAFPFVGHPWGIRENP